MLSIVISWILTRLFFTFQTSVDIIQQSLKSIYVESRLISWNVWTLESFRTLSVYHYLLYVNVLHRSSSLPNRCLNATARLLSNTLLMRIQINLLTLRWPYTPYWASGLGGSRFWSYKLIWDVYAQYTQLYANNDRKHVYDVHITQIIYRETCYRVYRELARNSRVTRRYTQRKRTKKTRSHRPGWIQYMLNIEKIFFFSLK